jgi:hypothetical protein
MFDGQPEGLTRDDILYNVTLYWLTNTAASSARLYRESKLAFFAPKGGPIPAARTPWVRLLAHTRKHSFESKER